jgi:hypothetical protein
VEHSFREEVLFEFGDGDMPPVDYTRDGQHVFWPRFDDAAKSTSVVWDGVAGPQFDGWVFFNGTPVIFSPDKRHVAWIGTRGGTFVVVVDNSIRGEWDNVDTEVVPVVSNSGRIALIANVHGMRRVILDGSLFTNWEAEAPSRSVPTPIILHSSDAQGRIGASSWTGLLVPILTKSAADHLAPVHRRSSSPRTAHGLRTARSAAIAGTSWSTASSGPLTMVSTACRSSAPTGRTWSIRR